MTKAPAVSVLKKTEAKKQDKIPVDLDLSLGGGIMTDDDR